MGFVCYMWGIIIYIVKYGLVFFLNYKLWKFIFLFVINFEFCWFCWFFDIWFSVYIKFGGCSILFFIRYRFRWISSRVGSIWIGFSYGCCFYKGEKCFLFCFLFCISSVFLFDRVVGNFVFIGNYRNEMVWFVLDFRMIIKIIIFRLEDINLVFIVKRIVCGRCFWFYYFVNEVSKSEIYIWIDGLYLFGKNGSDV